MQEDAREMYGKVQANSWVPHLEKDLEEAWLKWANLAKEWAALAVEVKMLTKLEADVAELQKTISELPIAHQDKIEGLRKTHQAEVERLCSLHSTERERKDSFCEVEKVRVLSELQASYNKKLHGLYLDQYELGY